MNNLLKKPNKMKGFTIVELVIVIAVIAILAAVLIPTFSNVIDKANESKALQEARNAYAEAFAEAMADGKITDGGETIPLANGFTFKFTTANECEVTQVPAGFGYTVSVSNGKVTVTPGTGGGQPDPDPNPGQPDPEPDDDDDQVKVPANLKVLSQNLRYADDGDGNNVAERFPRFKKLIEEYKPDLIGTQEGKSNWIDLLETLEGYAIIGCSRAGEHDTNDDEWNAILYKTERFEDRNNSGTFWLTDTPTEPGTIIPNLTYNYRICTWAELYDKYTGETVIFANTHLDDTNDTYRARQAAYLLQHLKNYLGDKYNNCTIYLTGDFNCESGTDPYNAITVDGGFVDASMIEGVNKSLGVQTTWHEYGGVEDGYLIDFCFYKKGNETVNETVLEYEIITKNYKAGNDTEEGYVSDHYGVIAIFKKFKAS